MPLDETQLSALVDAAVREAVRRTAGDLTAKHEAETEGLRRKRDELLAERKPWQDSLDASDALIARADETLRLSREQEQRWASKDADAMFSAVREHTITRDEARSGQAYREAKAAAEKAGVILRITDTQAPAQSGRRSSPVKLVKDADAGVCYVNAELVQRLGQARCRQLAVEHGAPTMRAFRSVDDLPDSVRQAHAQALADRAPGSLLEGGK